MRKPNLFIVGAPKCGTTSLARWLDEHLQVYMSPVKEPHYFYSPFRPPMSLEDYEALFSKATESQPVVAEASTWYLRSAAAIDAIERYSPGSKFVVCLRNPVELAISAHGQAVSLGDEKETDFDVYWKSHRNSKIKCRAVPGVTWNGNNIDVTDYRYGFQVGVQLDMLLSRINRNRVHVILLDDLRDDPGEVWERLQDFLEIGRDGRKSFTTKNPSRIARSPRLGQILNGLHRMKASLGIGRSFGFFRRIHAMNRKTGKLRPPSAATHREMVAAFESDILLLQKILDRDLTAWLHSADIHEET